MVFFHKSQNPSLIVRKQQTNPTEIYSTNYRVNALQKPQGHEQKEKTEKRSQAREDEHGDYMQYGILD